MKALYCRNENIKSLISKPYLRMVIPVYEKEEKATDSDIDQVRKYKAVKKPAAKLSRKLI